MIIYEIVCNITGERYIGSTKNTLETRMRQHKRTNDPSRKSYCSSKKIIDRGDYQVNILEKTLFGKEREQYYLDTLPNINRQRANGHKIRDRKPYMTEYNKRYIKENKEKIGLQQKKIYQYKISWGGYERTNNNLLNISMDLFH